MITPDFDFIYTVLVDVAINDKNKNAMNTIILISLKEGDML